MVRCILYPGTKIIIASGNKKQASEVISKIHEQYIDNANLKREISNIKAQGMEPICEFRNGSWIKVVASNDGARSARANLLIVDEFRMVDKDIIDKVLRRFLTAPRQPKYLHKSEYRHLKERNKEIYMSSAWYTFHWSYAKMRTFFTSMMEGKKYFIAGLPYQVSIMEGLLDEEQVKDEMSEDDFEEIGWGMEMSCLWYGESEKAFFKFNDINSSRNLMSPIYSNDVYENIKLKSLKKPPKKSNVIRYVAADIALMASKGKENDASAYAIFELIPNKRGYKRNIIYMESMTGGHTNIQSARIMKLFKDFECDYIVLDCHGNGMGVYDQLCQGAIDRENNIEYDPVSCMNDDEMANRCIDSNAEKLVYSVKANSKFNSDIAKSLKDNLKRNQIKILINENDAKKSLYRMAGWEKLPIEQKDRLLEPYKQTTTLINEMVNLTNEGNGDIVKLKEPRSGRKDRYSCVAYGNYFANYLEREYLRKEDSNDWLNFVVNTGASFDVKYY